jgi:lipoprotein-anchoring transpeptidase ErfK/SrfK
MRKLLIAFGCAILFTSCSSLQDSFQDTIYDMRGLPPGKRSIVINLSEQRAFLYAGGEMVLSGPVSTGREGYHTAPGRYSVIQKDIDHRSSEFGAYCDRDDVIVKPDVSLHKDPRPPGTHFVGAPMPYFLRFYDGVGMHQGYLPGYPASHGCIRTTEPKAKRFFEAVKVGTSVRIVE